MWNPHKSKNLVALALWVLAAATVLPAQEPVTLETPAEIHGLSIRPAGEGIEVRVLADGPLIWSQYRTPDGRLAIDLPNSVVTPSVENLQPIVGLVAEVAVESEARGSRPLTRLVDDPARRGGALARQSGHLSSAELSTRVDRTDMAVGLE